MNPAVCPSWRGGRAGRLFLFNSGSELVARMSVLVCSGRRGGVAGRLFRLNSGNELVAVISHVVRAGKRDGRASSLFRFTGNLGRVFSFPASLAVAALHSHMIVAQRAQTGLSIPSDNAPISEDDKIFSTWRASNSGTVGQGTAPKQGSYDSSCLPRLCSRPTLWILPQRRGSNALARTKQITCRGIAVFTGWSASLASGIQPRDAAEG